MIGSTVVTVTTGAYNATITADGISISNGGTITIPNNQIIGLSWKSNGGSSCSLRNNTTGVVISTATYGASTASSPIDSTKVGNYTYTCRGMNSFNFTIVADTVDTTSVPTVTANGTAVLNGGTITIPALGSVTLRFKNGCIFRPGLFSSSGTYDSLSEMHSWSINEQSVGSYTIYCGNVDPLNFTIVVATPTARERNLQN